MIRRNLGCTFGSCLLVLSGVSALGAGGYMTMTGKSVCSLVQGCGEKADSAENKNVTTVAAKEGEKKGCCSLSKTVAAKSGECSKPCTGEGKAEAVAAKSGECAKACSGEAKVVDASAKSGECAKACSAAKVASAKRGFYLMNGSVPVAMPAMFYNNKAGFCTASLKEVGGCDKPCTGEATVSTAAATEAKSGCCKGKTTAVSTVAAKEGAAAGCCKGTGTRADGTPCQKDGDHCDQGKKTAEGEKAPAEAQKTGEPVASRE
jgi:hypothetical protein